MKNESDPDDIDHCCCRSHGIGLYHTRTRDKNYDHG